MVLELIDLSSSSVAKFSSLSSPIFYCYESGLDIISIPGHYLLQTLCDNILIKHGMSNIPNQLATLSR